MWSLAEAHTRILESALPGEAIEVPLPEAVGLVLAEPAVGDVDQPPFDRAALDGYALRAADTVQGVRHRLIARRRGRVAARSRLARAGRYGLGAGEPMPVGADAVLRTEDSRPSRAPVPARRASSKLAAGGAGGERHPAGRAASGRDPAGASRDTARPVAGRTARGKAACTLSATAVPAWRCWLSATNSVGAGDAPVMHRERNAAGPAVAAPCVLWGAPRRTILGPSSRAIRRALDRALTAPVVVILVRARPGRLPAP